MVVRSSPNDTLRLLAKTGVVVVATLLLLGIVTGLVVL
jgi:hypothetical protein